MKATKPEPGERHGRLVYVGGDERRQVSRFGSRPVFAYFGKWRCDCGAERTYRNSQVVKGYIKSCGCLRKATGEEWKRGKRVKRQPLPHLVPQYLVFLLDKPELMTEIFDPAKELAVWHSKDEVSVLYDATCVSQVWRRKDARSWERICIPDFAGILERTPGVHVCTSDKEPPASFAVDGWEVVQ